MLRYFKDVLTNTSELTMAFIYFLVGIGCLIGMTYNVYNIDCFVVNIAFNLSLALFYAYVYAAFMKPMWKKEWLEEATKNHNEPTEVSKLFDHINKNSAD